jgi:hypothetical protein
MKRNPERGDVIRLPKKKADYLVVEAGERTDEDSIRGEYYHAYVFEIINLEYVGLENPTTYTFHLAGSSINVGTEVKVEDIEFVKKVKLQTKTITIYEVK